MSQLQLCLHHELMLLVLDDAKGNFTGGLYACGLSGAILSELMLQGIIVLSKDDSKLVEVVDTKSIEDPILNEVVQKIADSKKPKDLKYWVSIIAATPNLNHRIAQQLCDLGILRYDESKVLWFFTCKRYPEIDSTFEDAIRKRMGDVMFSPNVKPDERTAVLISLGKSSQALASNFPAVELKQHDEKIKEICEGKHLASGATTETIEAVQAAILAGIIASTIAVSVTASIRT